MRTAERESLWASMNPSDRTGSLSSNKIIFDCLKERSKGPEILPQHELLALDTTDRSISQLFADENRSPFSPSFSPATQRLAVTHYKSDSRNPSRRLEIVFVSLNGDPPAYLSSTRLSPQAAKFSPDGKRIAVEIGFDDESNPDLWVFEGLDKIIDRWVLATQIALIQNPLHIGIHAPRFFPDGCRLIYLRNYAYEDALEVCLTDLTEPGEPERDLEPGDRVGDIERAFGFFRRRRLTHNADVVWRRSNALALHAASETALFIRGHFKHEYEQICTVPCSADARQDPLATSSISENFKHIGGICLSPDGLQLAFDGDGQLYVAALDGGDLLQLTDKDDGECNCFTFSPDSSQIAFARGGGAKAPGIWCTDRFRRNCEQLLSPNSGRIRDILWV
jgi:Tol biopolymer transport system component